jgi:hypothetical protein
MNGLKWEAGLVAWNPLVFFDEAIIGVGLVVDCGAHGTARSFLSKVSPNWKMLLSMIWARAFTSRKSAGMYLR